MFVNTGLQRFVSRAGLGGSRRTSTFLLDSAATIIPGHAGGSTVPTYTRATTATVTDFEGRLVTVPSGATREQGARFVQNLLTYTEDLSFLSRWNYFYGDSPPIVTTGQSAPDGTATAFKVQTFGNTAWGYSPSGAYITPYVGAKIKGSIWLRADSSISIVFGHYDTTTLAVSDTLAVTTAWQRFSTSSLFTVGTILSGSWFYLQGTSLTYYVWHPQDEVVTGQSNQNPSEYVSVGVLSAPFHGAGIDGCKWFNTMNGNTVA